VWVLFELKLTCWNRLAITKDKSLENKENIPPIFNYLAQDTPSRTLTRPVSPPPKPLNNPRTQSSILADEATQTLFSYIDSEVQTDSIPSLDDLRGAYQELASSYNDIRYELDQYKEAYNRLAEKYALNKAVWKQWSEQENARLINSKKRRIGRGTTEPQTVGRKFNDYITPATSITGGSPTPRAPNISPIKPRFRPSAVHSSPKKGGLFYGLLGSGAGVAGGMKESFELVGENSLIAGDPKEGPEELASSPLSSPPSSLSFPETQAPPKIFGVTQDSKSRGDGDPTESEDEPRSSDHYSGALNEPVLPSPDPAFKVPVIKKEIDACGYGCISLEGDSVARPVIIKSESHASSEGFGYHIFDQGSLDLDDIGQKPQTPRKRQKPRHPELETTENISRPGWISGGFRITPTGDTGEIQDTENDLPALALPLPTTGEGNALGIRSDSHLARPTTPMAMARAGPGSSPPFSIQNKGGKTPPPLRRSSRTSAAREAISSTTEEKKIDADAPQKTKKRRIATPRAIASFAEDGTDGCEDINPISIHPPMTLSEKQRNRLERDMKGTARLDDILNSPPSRTPNLTRLKKNIQSRTSPAKKRTWGGDGFEATPVRPSSSAGPSTSTRRAGGNAKSKARDISALDIFDFRVNPEVNGGKDYAFTETVRNREARKCLPGCMKACCRDLVGFAEAAGLPAVSKGPKWRSSSPALVEDCELPGRSLRNGPVSKEDKAKEFTNRYGRHRDAFERRRSPPGFWDADFPTTQELEQQRVAAEEMRKNKVEDMRKEAERGSKGRFVFKD